MIKLSEFYFSLLQYHKEFELKQIEIYNLQKNKDDEEIKEIVSYFDNKWKTFLQDSDIFNKVNYKDYRNIFLSEKEMYKNELKKGS